MNYKQNVDNYQSFRNQFRVIERDLQAVKPPIEWEI